MTDSNKITIFDILAKIDAKDPNFYTDLPEEVQKAEHPLVLMKWMAGTNDRLQIMMLNEVVNPYVFSLYKHKPLLMKMLTICASGKRKRYKWTKLKKSQTVKFPMLVDLIKRVFEYSTAEALDVVKLIPPQTYLEYADQIGLQKEELSKVKKELRLLAKQ